MKYELFLAQILRNVKHFKWFLFVNALIGVLWFTCFKHSIKLEIPEYDFM